MACTRLQRDVWARQVAAFGRILDPDPASELTYIRPWSWLVAWDAELYNLS